MDSGLQEKRAQRLEVKRAELQAAEVTALEQASSRQGGNRSMATRKLRHQTQSNASVSCEAECRQSDLTEGAGNSKRDSVHSEAMHAVEKESAVETTQEAVLSTPCRQLLMSGDRVAIQLMASDQNASGAGWLSMTNDRVGWQQNRNDSQRTTQHFVLTKLMSSASEKRPGCWAATSASHVGIDGDGLAIRPAVDRVVLRGCGAGCEHLFLTVDGQRTEPNGHRYHRVGRKGFCPTDGPPPPLSAALALLLADGSDAIRPLCTGDLLCIAPAGRVNAGLFDRGSGSADVRVLSATLLAKEMTTEGEVISDVKPSHDEGAAFVVRFQQVK